jgi:hypothetical protein
MEQLVNVHCGHCDSDEGCVDCGLGWVMVCVDCGRRILARDAHWDIEFGSPIGGPLCGDCK